MDEEDLVGGGLEEGGGGPVESGGGGRRGVGVDADAARKGAEVGAGLVLGKKSELVRRSGADGPHPKMPDRRAVGHRSGCGKVVSAPSES